jgi:hypothetical protein
LIIFSSLGHGDIDYCHVFDFMLGMLWYNIPQPDDGGDDDDYNEVRYSDLALLDLAFRYPHYRELNEYAFNSSYAASTYGYYDDPEWRKLAYNFCENSMFSNLTCSLLMFNTYDEISTITTDYYYPVKKGACNNSFTIAEFDKFVESPPTELIQDYFVCTNSVSFCVPHCLSLILSSSLLLAEGCSLFEYWYRLRKCCNLRPHCALGCTTVHLFVPAGQFVQITPPSISFLNADDWETPSKR